MGLKQTLHKEQKHCDMDNKLDVRFFENNY